MPDKIIDLHNLKEYVGGITDDASIDDILIRLPNNKLVTFQTYVDDNWYQVYDIRDDHSMSPLLKKKNIPNGWESKSTKKRQNI